MCLQVNTKKVRFEDVHSGRCMPNNKGKGKATGGKGKGGQGKSKGKKHKGKGKAGDGNQDDSDGNNHRPSRVLALRLSLLSHVMICTQ